MHSYSNQAMHRYIEHAIRGEHSRMSIEREYLVSSACAWKANLPKEEGQHFDKAYDKVGTQKQHVSLRYFSRPSSFWYTRIQTMGYLNNYMQLEENAEMDTIRSLLA